MKLAQCQTLSSNFAINSVFLRDAALRTSLVLSLYLEAQCSELRKFGMPLILLTWYSHSRVSFYSIIFIFTRIVLCFYVCLYVCIFRCSFLCCFLRNKRWWWWWW